MTEVRKRPGTHVHSWREQWWKNGTCQPADHNVMMTNAHDTIPTKTIN